MKNLSQSLKTALNRRLQLMQTMKCLRLFDGIGDGLSGLQIDLIDSVLMVHLNSSAGLSMQEIEQGLFSLIENLKLKRTIRAAYLWQRQSDPRDTVNKGVKKLTGEASDEFELEAEGLNFIFRPALTPSGGFFTDSREVKHWLQNNCKGKRILNLFCFTGTLGISAAIGGAREVAQIDISKSVLTWCKANWELNQIENCIMRFIPEDGIKFLERENRRIAGGKPAWDVVIIDPPAFSDSNGNIFSLENKLELLSQLAVEVLNKQGTIIFAGNIRELSPEDFLYSLQAAGGQFKNYEKILPPKDDFFSEWHEGSTIRGVLATGLR